MSTLVTSVVLYSLIPSHYYYIFILSIYFFINIYIYVCIYIYIYICSMINKNVPISDIWGECKQTATKYTSNVYNAKPCQSILILNSKNQVNALHKPKMLRCKDAKIQHGYYRYLKAYLYCSSAHINFRNTLSWKQLWPTQSPHDDTCLFLSINTFLTTVNLKTC